jgi:DNA-binding transcriptional ArsR family regulator
MTVMDDGLSRTFGALADPTRRAILARLAGGEVTVSQLAEPFAMTQQAISKHLKVLERAGLISRSRTAQSRPCRLEPQQLDTAAEWIGRHRQLWAARFDRLDDHLATVGRPGAAPGHEAAEHGRARAVSKASQPPASQPPTKGEGHERDDEHRR